MSNQIKNLKMEVRKLQEFKDYVHSRLDTMGIEKDPESEHRGFGCRIGGRLDIVEKLIQKPENPIPKGAN
jgi:hypothetical protein